MQLSGTAVPKSAPRTRTNLLRRMCGCDTTGDIKTQGARAITIGGGYGRSRLDDVDLSPLLDGMDKGL